MSTNHVTVTVEIEKLSVEEPLMDGSEVVISEQDATKKLTWQDPTSVSESNSLQAANASTESHTQVVDICCSAEEEGLLFAADAVAESEKITLRSISNYKVGDSVNVYLPGLPVVTEVTSVLTRNRGRGPQFLISLEHGPFKWTIQKYYRDFLSLRRVLDPLRLKIKGTIRRGRKRGYLPHLLSIQDISPLQRGHRTQSQLPKTQRFLNAVLINREFRSNKSTLEFLEIGRLSFVEDIGSKRKEGLVFKRSGGYSVVTNCLGCTACCVCRCSVWRKRWLVLKDSYLVYISASTNLIAGVLLFDAGTMVSTGRSQTNLLHGLRIGTMTRTLLVKCHSSLSLKEWKMALMEVMASTGKVWVTEKRFLSFAPPRTDVHVQWLVDGADYFSQVAHALLAAKDEIYITDWILSPQIYLKRSCVTVHNLNFRLDKIIFRKANEGVKVYIQIYKDITVALDLGSEYVKEEYKHKNIVVLRHPEHISTGVYKWAHHEKIVVVDQTLAFVGGIDLGFGRFDDCCHCISDTGYSVQLQAAEASLPAREETVYRWMGMDYYNPYIKDLENHNTPHEDLYDREVVPRMPWHDVASCVFGAPARDVARHFIQRYNFTRHEQSLYVSPLLPRSEFRGTEKELFDSKYLYDVLRERAYSQADVQILRSAGQWSAGNPVEQSILTAYLHAIKNAEHFIYIENQFFISSLKEVKNLISTTLRLRIAKAHRENKVFRVIIVMPLLPSFNGDFADSTGTILKTVVSWNYKTISHGTDSLYSRLTRMNAIPEEELSNYISVYGLRTHGEILGNLVSEIVYVHSKCMIVDDRITIIGSANVNDRSLLGDRDSEMAIFVEDRDMVEGRMNGLKYPVGKFAHSLRCQLFKEHLGLLADQDHMTPDGATINVEDPVCEEFLSAWRRIADKNMDIFEMVFGGGNIPTDTVRNYSQLKSFKSNLGMVATDVERSRELLQQLQGFLVPMPLKFLEEEDLQPQFGKKEALAPEVFT